MWKQIIYSLVLVKPYSPFKPSQKCKHFSCMRCSENKMFLSATKDPTMRVKVASSLQRLLVDPSHEAPNSRLISDLEIAHVLLNDTEVARQRTRDAEAEAAGAASASVATAKSHLRILVRGLWVWDFGSASYRQCAKESKRQEQKKVIPTLKRTETYSWVARPWAGEQSPPLAMRFATGASRRRMGRQPPRRRCQTEWAT